MSVNGGTNIEPNFRQSLVIKALNSKRQGIRKYYNIWSTTDYAVPGFHRRLSKDLTKQRVFKYLCHYGLVVWLNILYWLDKIYNN
jgi:hypothetical protein